MVNFAVFTRNSSQFSFIRSTANTNHNHRDTYFPHFVSNVTRILSIGIRGLGSISDENENIWGSFSTTVLLVEHLTLCQT